MTRKSLFALIVVLTALTWAAGAAPAPGPAPIQFWPSTGTMDPGGYLGVYLDDIDAESTEELELPEERGARIERVVEDGPAAEAGFEHNDVVLDLNGTRVESAAQLKRMVSETPAGRKVRMEVFRKGERTVLEPVLGSRAGLSTGGGAPPLSLDPHHGLPGMQGRGGWPSFGPDEDPRRPASQKPPRLGVAMLNLPEQLATFFGLEDQTGVLIGSVLEGSAAEAAGLKAGDILLEIDDEPVGDPAGVQRVIARKDGLIDLKILRDKERISIGAELKAKDESEEDERSFPRNAM